MTSTKLVVPTSAFASIPQQPQQEPTPIAKSSRKGGKSQEKGTKEKTPPTTLAHLKSPKPIPPCALCDVVGHATNNCFELPHVKDVVTNTFPDSNIPEVHVTLTESAKRNISL